MAKKNNEKLTKLIGVRLSQTDWSKLEQQRSKTNARTIGEYARAVLNREKLVVYRKNTELESVAVELIAIRKELNAIGKNINQVVRSFHAASSIDQKVFHALGASADYRKVGEKVDGLLKLADVIIQRWLTSQK